MMVNMGLRRRRHVRNAVSYLYSTHLTRHCSDIPMYIQEIKSSQMQLVVLRVRDDEI